jgi:hypothetical protein
VELQVEQESAELGQPELARAEIQVRRETRILQQAAQEETPVPVATPAVGAGLHQEPAQEECPVVLEAALRVGWVVQGLGRWPAQKVQWPDRRSFHLGFSDRLRRSKST